MKKMNKVLGLLAFAGVVTGVSLNAADVSGHPLAVAVKSIFNGMVKGGFTVEDLRQAHKTVDLFDAAASSAWDVIQARRNMRPSQSFATYFTQKELQCVINGYAHVVEAFEVAAPTIWKHSSAAQRSEYKDAVLVAFEHLVADAGLKVEAAYQASAIYASQRGVIMADVTAQIDALKARVNNVFTVAPQASPLNAQPVGVKAPESVRLPRAVTTRDVEGMGAVFSKRVASVGAGLICFFIGTAAAAQAAGLI